MNHEEIKDRLNDYGDGLLPEDERRTVERHLEGCEECREEVRSLRSLLSDLAALPIVAPERDLWPDILERIGEKRVVSADFGRPEGRSVWLKRGMLAAAAVVLMVFSSVITALLVRHRPEVSVAIAPEHYAYEHRVAGALSEFRDLAVPYSLVIEELSALLRARKSMLAPETVAVLEANLRIIDEAIEQSRVALAADPGNQKLIYTVSTMYEEKVALLQQATHLLLF